MTKQLTLGEEGTSEQEVFLVIRVPSREMVKIRGLLHEQTWYTGDDVPITSGRDYFGVTTEDLHRSLKNYFEWWKAIAREKRNA